MDNQQVRFHVHDKNIIHNTWKKNSIFICIFQTKQNSTETTRRYLLHTQTKE